MKKIVSLFLSIFAIALFNNNVFAAGATTPYYPLNAPGHVSNLKAGQEPATHIQIKNYSSFDVQILEPDVRPYSSFVPRGYIYHLINEGYYGDTYLVLADMYGHTPFFHKWVSNHATVIVTDLSEKGVSVQ